MSSFVKYFPKFDVTVMRFRDPFDLRQSSQERGRRENRDRLRSCVASKKISGGEAIFCAIKDLRR